MVAQRDGPELTDEEPKPNSEPGRTGAMDRVKHWGGYGWFMSFGTVLPLFVFLGSYLVHVTLIGEPVAKRLYPTGIWISTLGQPPPGQEKLASHEAATDKESFVDRVRRHSPPGYLERRGKPVPTFLRAVWFVLVGWWLGALWVLFAWSLFLLPYPFPGTVAGLLDELPSVMTLAYPQYDEARERSPAEDPGRTVEPATDQVNLADSEH